MRGGNVLLVRLGRDLYALPIAAVEEVLPALPIEPVPQCPDFIRGVIFVRGHLIPVLDAAERLGLKTTDRPDESNIVCMRVGERLMGVEFDEVLDLVDLSQGEVLDSRDLGARGGFFMGVIEHDGQYVRLLDPDKLTSSSEKEEWLRTTQ